MDGTGSETYGADGDELGVREWFALGGRGVGSRVVAAARIAAVLHEEAARGGAEGVGVPERLMLLEGVGAEEGAA